MAIKNLDELKAKISIAEVIKSFIPLKKEQGTYKSLCPFHSEKTPSFVVSEQKNLFHCFGCKESGDAFSFVQKFKHYDFNEAVQEIANLYNFELEFSSQKAQQKKDYFEFYERLNKHFKENLLKHEKLLKYLEKRGLNKDDLNRFDIGLVDDNFALKEFIGKDIEMALNTGFLIKGQNGIYSQFAKRLSFALRNTIFKIVGFSCRIHPYENFSQNPAKYINSKESFLFHKSNFLYNLNYAKAAYFKRNTTPKNTQGEVSLSENRGLEATSSEIECVNSSSERVANTHDLHQRDKPLMLIVEGFMDSIALNKFDFKSNVAACGTAFNQTHLATLCKLGIENFALCFDKDEAGLKATLKTCELLFKYSFFESEIWQIKGEFKDLGEILEKSGADNENTTPLSDYFYKFNAFEFYIKEVLAQKETAREKDKFLNALLKSIHSKNNYFLKSFCLEILEKITGKEFHHTTQKVSLKKVSFESERAVFKTILCDEKAAFIAREMLNSSFFGEFENSFKAFVEKNEVDFKAQELKDDETVSVLNAFDFDEVVKSLRKTFLKNELEKAKVARNFSLICSLQQQIQNLDKVQEVF